MRIRQIIGEVATAGATSAGAIATVAIPHAYGDIPRDKNGILRKNPRKTMEQW